MTEEEMGFHHRDGEVARLHKRVEDLVTKKIMTKITIRMIVIMAGAVTLVGGFMVWVASGQVTSHENVEHRYVVTEPHMDKEHKKIRDAIQSDLGDLQDEVQDLNETVQEYHKEQQKQYIELLKEIRKIN